ncbi:hypothetical protein COO60DRAFT_1625229 [Scenedesmus sp. NREL 46B-D3]|nr:hypothetical protein COO60DRAFT_1625229 [Scenedesmus sp. NREL 46B-D3]
MSTPPMGHARPTPAEVSRFWVTRFKHTKTKHAHVTILTGTAATMDTLCRRLVTALASQNCWGTATAAAAATHERCSVAEHRATADHQLQHLAVPGQQRGSHYPFARRPPGMLSRMLLLLLLPALPLSCTAGLAVLAGKKLSPCDVAALKKCLEENKGDRHKCEKEVAAFQQACSAPAARSAAVTAAAAGNESSRMLVLAVQQPN